MYIQVTFDKYLFMKKSTTQPTKRLNRIAEVMKEYDVTQEGLSNDTGLTQTSISLYVNGHREPSLETLFKISKTLKVPGKDLISF